MVNLLDEVSESTADFAEDADGGMTNHESRESNEWKRKNPEAFSS